MLKRALLVALSGMALFGGGCIVKGASVFHDLSEGTNQVLATLNTFGINLANLLGGA